MRKRRLGKGLDSLLSPGVMLADDASEPGQQLQMLPVDIVVRGKYQPRSEIKPQELTELADSIRAQGVVQPIVVRSLDGSRNYEIIAGERRWRAAQQAGLHEVPAIIRKVSNETAMCLALIENIQRQDLNPVEEARALARLLEEFGMTHEAIATAVGKSRPSISNLLRLLELAPQVRELLETGAIEMGHGKVILGLASPKEQAAAAKKVVAQSLSVRATEHLVKRLKNKAGQNKNTDGKKRLDPDLAKIQERLSERLGTNVVIKHGKSGGGKLEITYYSTDELDGILAHIK